jgi:cell division protein FtsW
MLRLGLFLLPVLLITKNLSSAIILFAISVVMLFVSSPKIMQFVMTGILAVVGIVLFIQVGFRAARIDAWLHPETSEKGGQILQSLYAIGSGGVFGKGLGNSVQKLGFIPESQNDMIFSIICEELGIFGATCLILLFIIMIWRMFVIASNVKDLFGWLLVVGVMSHVAIQVILNIAVATNSIPNTGVTLPFVSSGGSALFFMMIEIGIVFSVSRNIEYDY